MNDTPRTDMHRLTVAGRYAPAEVVDAEVARTLERELAAAKAQADEGKKAQDELNRITAYVMGYWPASFCFTHPFQAVQHVGNEMAKAQKENAELRAEVERLRKDAERYRFRHSNYVDADGYEYGYCKVRWKNGAVNSMLWASDEEIDAAMNDAAIGKEM